MELPTCSQVNFCPLRPTRTILRDAGSRSAVLAWFHVRPGRMLCRAATAMRLVVERGGVTLLTAGKKGRAKHRGGTAERQRGE